MLHKYVNSDNIKILPTILSGQPFCTWTDIWLCLDMNECSANSNNCDVNAVCKNSQGSYTCTCRAGYTGDGKTCSGKMFYNVY